MLPKNKKKFEFNLGKTGLITFIIGGAFLMLVSFLLGVVVGRDDENMSRFIFFEAPHRLLSVLPVSDGDEPPKAANAALTDRGERVEAAPGAAAGVLADSPAPVNAINFDAEKAVANKTADTSNNPLPSAATVNASKKEGKFVVRYGLFQQKENASGLCRRLVANGFRARQISVNIPQKGTMLAVVSSEFDSEEKARQFARKVVNKLKGIKPIVTPCQT